VGRTSDAVCACHLRGWSTTFVADGQVGPLTSDGRTLCFNSEQHLLPHDANPGRTTPTRVTGGDIFAYDVRSHMLRYVDIGPDGRQMKGDTYLQDIPPNGRFVLFADRQGREWVRDREYPTTTLLSGVGSGSNLAPNWILRSARWALR